MSKTNMKLVHLHLYLYEISMNIMRLQIACNLINMFMLCNLESMILTYNITHHFSFNKYVKEYFFLFSKTRYCATARILFLISSDYKWFYDCNKMHSFPSNNNRLYFITEIGLIKQCSLVTKSLYKGVFLFFRCLL